MIPLSLLVAQWSVHEIDLSARGRYANPDRNVSVIADFAGPEQVTVQGYWVGETRYRVRFTPTKPGHYTYAVRSHPTDIGLHAEGAFDVEPAKGGFAAPGGWGLALASPELPACPVTRYRIAAGPDLEDSIRVLARRGAIAELAVDGLELAVRSAVKRYAAFPNVVWRPASERIAAIIREADPWTAWGRMAGDSVLIPDRRGLWTAALGRVTGTLTDTGVCGDLALLLKFFADRRLDTSRFVPRGPLTLSDGEREFVIYVPDGGAAAWRGARANYGGEVFNPVDGTSSPLTWTPARGHDWVIHARVK